MQPPQGAGTGEVTSPTCPPGPPSLTRWLGAEGLGSGVHRYLLQPYHHPQRPTLQLGIEHQGVHDFGPRGHLKDVGWDRLPDRPVTFQDAAERLLTLGGQCQEVGPQVDLVHARSLRTTPDQHAIQFRPFPKLNVSRSCAYSVDDPVGGGGSAPATVGVSPLHPTGRSWQWCGPHATALRPT
jgi:hypothetical protein